MTDTIERQVRDKFISIIKGVDLGFDATPNVRDLMLEQFEPENWAKKLRAQIAETGKREPRLWCVDVGRDRQNAGTDQCYLDIIIVLVKGYYRKSKRLEMIDHASAIIDAVYTNQPTFGGLVSRLEGSTQPSFGTLDNANEYAGEIVTVEIGFELQKQVEN